MASLTFLGAAQEVTGSCYLLETLDGVKVLLECGMRQGRREADNGNRAPFPFDPASIDAVVISHAHLDHSGLLPRLAAEGFKGPIFATEATCELLELMLLDSAHIQEKDAEWENRWRNRIGKPSIKPLYTQADTERALKLRRPISLGSTVAVARGVRVTFHNAGHILGSSIVEVQFHDQVQPRRLVFSGDLGNTCSPLMRAPSPLSRADVVMLESTYGDRDHRDSNDTLEELAAILDQAHRDGGNVLIPSFAVGRTQDLLYYLGRFYQEGRLPQQAVFLDSPMAARANGIYLRHSNEFDDRDREYIRAPAPPAWRNGCRCCASPAAPTSRWRSTGSRAARSSSPAAACAPAAVSSITSSTTSGARNAMWYSPASRRAAPWAATSSTAPARFACSTSASRSRRRSIPSAASPPTPGNRSCSTGSVTSPTVQRYT